jgi:cyclophilin family peptidyl-prolyl cis-trans isomerase
MGLFGFGRRKTTARTNARLWLEELEPRVVLTNDFYLVSGIGEQNLAFRWTVRDAKFNNEVGVFSVDDAQGRVNGILPGSPGYDAAVFQGIQIVFRGNQTAGARRELSFNGGSRLGFVLIQNGTIANHQTQNPNNQLGRPLVAFFSFDNASPDGFDHVRTQTLGDGRTRFSWEDITGGGDQDFNDLVFTVGIAGERATTVPGIAGQTVPTTFTWLSREAGFNNEIGLFRVDSADGRIGTLQPSDPGYARAALTSSTRQTIFASGQGAGAITTLSLPGGSLFGLYLIQNTSTAGFLSQNPDNAPGVITNAFFSFTDANPDRFDHWIWQSDKEFVFEDLFMGGDRDFNDGLIRVEFGTPSRGPAVDNDAPVITARLANDTQGPGGTNTDRITFDPTIAGSATDASEIQRLRAGFDSTPVANFFDITQDVQPDQSFRLTRQRLEQINRGQLTDGVHVLRLEAEDNRGNTSGVFEFTFTLDTVVSAPSFDLAPDSDTAPIGDRRTTLTNVTLVGQTDPGARVELVQTGSFATADGTGRFTFANVVLGPGANDLVTQATDLAGNLNRFTTTITRDTNNAPFVGTAIADVTVQRNAANTILDLAGNFDDLDITNSLVRFDTVRGPINVELFDRQTPRTVANFFNYITDNDFRDSIFHRRPDPLFVLQGGGFTFQPNPSRLVNVPTDPPVANEPGISNTRGTIAMAKLGNDPNSATSQFFFNLVNNAQNLDNQNGGFTVFGQVIGDGMTVVDNLATIPIQNQGGAFTDIPLIDYNGTNFPTDTTRDNFALVSNIAVVRRTELLTYTVVSNSNPALVTASIDRNRLTLSYTPDQFGTADLVIRATDSGGATVETSVRVTVT